MATKSKRTLAIRAMVDRNNRYAIEEALELVKKMATTKFDESVDVAVGLGIDPRKSDQVVRG
ncbi:50S ribosomal protein L1, partial [Acidithiobacillus ferrooxidans F221]|nr:50S ribosomal protein L1 [Acidithiobacillus ferrooxidans F221]